MVKTLPSNLPPCKNQRGGFLQLVVGNPTLRPTPMQEAEGRISAACWKPYPPTYPQARTKGADFCSLLETLPSDLPPCKKQRGRFLQLVGNPTLRPTPMQEAEGRISAACWKPYPPTYPDLIALPSAPLQSPVGADVAA